MATILKSENGKKIVRIISDVTGTYEAFYCQIFNEGGQLQEDVLDNRAFKKEAAAIRWAQNKLNLHLAT